jgi:hypothetical protein
VAYFNLLFRQFSVGTEESRTHINTNGSRTGFKICTSGMRVRLDALSEPRYWIEVGGSNECT